MPTFERTLHYRNIDVSTIKEICKVSSATVVVALAR